MLVDAAKPVVWVGSFLRDVRAFPAAARTLVGRELWRVQTGGDPSDFKPMRSVGSGAFEIRVHTQTEHRLIYVARFEEALYVLHAFEKRSRKTSQHDIEIARRRFAE